jgi:hypothetical protein
VYWQFVDRETDDTTPNFFEEAIAEVLNDEVIPFERSGFVVGISIKEVGERTPRDNCKPVVCAFSGQVAFLTNGPASPGCRR